MPEIAFCGYNPYSSSSGLEWYGINIPDPNCSIVTNDIPLAKGNDEKKDWVKCLANLCTKNLIPFSEATFSSHRNHAALGSTLYSLNNRGTQVLTLDLTSPINGWKPGVPMTVPRFNPRTCVLDGKLYVLGGFNFDPEFTSSMFGWIEVFDPSLGKWEQLPNPPCEIVASDYMISAVLKKKKQILVTKNYVQFDVNWKVKKLNYSVFYTYDVMTRCWAMLEPKSRWRHGEFPDPGNTKGVAVGDTLYWVFVDEEKDFEQCCFQAYDFKKDVWYQGRLKHRKIFGWYDCVTTHSPPGLVHLSGHIFCLLLQSSTCNENAPELNIDYLNCLVLELVPMFEERIKSEDEDKYDDDDEEEEEDKIEDKDKDKRKDVHVFESDGEDEDEDNYEQNYYFQELYIDIQAVQKYPMDHNLELLSSMKL